MCITSVCSVSPSVFSSDRAFVIFVRYLLDGVSQNDQLVGHSAECVSNFVMAKAAND